MRRATGHVRRTERSGVIHLDLRTQPGVHIDPKSTGDYYVITTSAGSASEGELIIQLHTNSEFGKGTHVSTRLLLQLLPSFVPQGGLVLDAGTGTGVLAIAAVKMGAAQAIAFDNHDWKKENAAENFVLNGVQDRVTFRSGSIEAVPEERFDLIVANITVDVHCRFMASYEQKLKPGGQLLLSGLLQRDKSEMVELFAEHGFELVDERTEDEWWAAAAKRM